MTRQAEAAYRKLDAAYTAAEQVTSGFELIGHLARLERLEREFRDALRAETTELPAMTDDELLAALSAWP